MLARPRLNRFLRACSSYPLLESPLISNVYTEKPAAMTLNTTPMSATVAIAVTDQVPFLAVYTLIRVVTIAPQLICLIFWDGMARTSHTWH